MAICSKCKRDLPADAVYCMYCGHKLARERSRRARGNGQGSVFKLKSGKYRAEVVIGWHEDGRKITRAKLFATKREAVNYLPTLMVARNEKILKVSEYYNQWLVASSENWSSSTQKAYAVAWKALAPIAGAKIDRVKLSDLQGIVDTYRDKSLAYVNNIKIVMRGVYKYAMIDNAVNKDLSAFVVLRRADQISKRDAFRKDEKQKIWDAWHGGNTFAGYVLILMYTGMRISEFLKLTVDSIDFEHKIITGVGVKTKKSKALPVYIPDIIVPVLKSIVAESENIIYAFGPDKFRYEFKRFCNQIGIRALSVHCCRHTCATDLLEANVPAAIVQTIMRHEKFDTTLIYTHLSASPILDALNSAYSDQI